VSASAAVRIQIGLYIGFSWGRVCGSGNETTERSASDSDRSVSHPCILLYGVLGFFFGLITSYCMLCT